MMNGQDAYLLRKTPHGERDYVLTLFTRDSGKISGFAKNAKTSGKRFGGRIEPFVLFRARYKERPGGLRLVDDAETVRVFRRLMEDVELFLWGSLALEIVDVLTPKDAPNEQMFEALTGLFTELDEGKSALPAILEFQLRTLALSGYEPNLETCAECGNDAGDRAHFSIRRGGVVCTGCGSRAENGGLISREFLRRRDLMELHLENVVKYVKLFLRFTEYHTEKKLNSSRFIEELTV